MHRRAGVVARHLDRTQRAGAGDFDTAGRLITDSLATYKIPDLDSAPDVDVTLLQRESPGLLGSKAVGEPPLVYGLGALFAIRAAIETVRSDLSTDVVAPMTPERIFTLLHGPLARSGASYA